MFSLHGLLKSIISSYVLREYLKPEVVFCYLWALQSGLKYRYETLVGNTVEEFFSMLKERTKRFRNQFPFKSSFGSVQRWKALLIYIT